MEVSNQIIQIVDTLCEKFGIVIDWTSENVIPYLSSLCDKYISYEIWTSVAWMGFMAVLGIAFAVVAKMLYPTFKRGWEANADSMFDVGWQVSGTFAIIFLIIFYLAAIFVVCTQIMDIVECLTFPEKQIFEYIRSLMNAAG